MRTKEGMLRDWKMKKVLTTIEKIANQKIEQGVLLKELAHSIKANPTEKTSQEWRDYVFGALSKMLEMETEILGLKKDL